MVVPNPTTCSTTSVSNRVVLNMRSGRSSRADAITNSPFVRALIKPMLKTIPNLISSSSTTPSTSHLISTQPLAQLSNSTTESTQAEMVEVESEVKLGKRRREESDEGEKNLVEVNYTANNLPLELNKYWAQRYRLFSLYDEGCQMDIEGWYSVTPELVAVQIAERCRSNVIVDAFCGVGGNAIQFAFTCEKVIAIDNSPIRLACALNNAKIYGVADRITFILADFQTWSKEYLKKKEKGEIKTEDEVEVIFLSPPWGGIDYMDSSSNKNSDPNNDSSTPNSKKISTITSSIPIPNYTPTRPSPTTATPSTLLHSTSDNILKLSYPLSAIKPLPGADLFTLSRSITPHIAYYLPRNTSMEEISELTTISPWINEETGEIIKDEVIEVEEEWMGRKLKAITVYFADLACKREDSSSINS